MVLTVIFLAAYVGSVLNYQAKQPVDRREKVIFDTIIIGLMLGLGLNLFEALKDMARIVRWRILSSRYFDIREVDLILGAESLMKVLRLMTLSRGKPLLRLICLGWLLINIGAQIHLATLTLFTSLKRGYNSSGITISQGKVNVPKLDCFYRSDMVDCDKDQARLDLAIAHTYGERGSFRGKNCTYQSTDDINNGPQICPYFIRNDQREFAVRYADTDPNDITNAYPYYGTGRIITTAATECTGYLTGLDFPPADGPDGKVSELVWRFVNTTGTYNLTIPRPSLAMFATTYVWNGTEQPHSETSQACGPRCLVLYALRDMKRGEKHEITIFQCHISVSPVSNIKDPAHVLSDSMARTAAASIALSGRWRMNGNIFDWRQFQLYQEGAQWAAKLDDTPEEVGARMAEFAAITLATMAERNPPTIVPGSLPTLGYQMDVEWKNTVLLTASIAAAHVLSMLLILWLTRPVIVLADSHLVMVLMLKELMDTVPNMDELGLLQETELVR